MFTKPVFILIIIAVIFGGIYFWLVTPLKTDTQLDARFDWPDETANYFWAKYYAQNHELAVFEPLNLIAQNQIHPRSFNVRSDGSLVPGSFLGLILFYGTLGRIFGVWAIIYFTPILAIFGVLAFYGIIKRLFNEKVAMLSAILMFFNPAWWYYSVTSMLPNVAFISSLLISLYFLFKDNKKLSLAETIASALFAGLAISIRPAEIVWLAAVYLAVVFYLSHKLKIGKIVLFLAVAFLMILPTLSQQQILFGSFLTSGYNQLEESQAASCSSCQLVKSLLLPFGFHPTLVASNFWTHYLSRFWWLSLLALLGLIAFLVQKGRQKIEVFGYIMLSLFLFAWLGIYYGSWQFSDLLTIHLNTLGLSYVRYWLPLYILALPFIALSLIWLTSLLRKRRIQNLGLLILLLILFYQSADLVLKAKPDSILPVRSRVASYKETAKSVIEVTEPDSVIVTVRKDKVFFPERKVIHTFDALSLSPEILSILPNLVKVTSVYYYALGPEPVLEFNNGLKLELVKNFDQEVLYKIK